MGQKFTSAEIEIAARDRTKQGIDSSKSSVGKLTQAVKGYYAEMMVAVGAVYAAVKIFKDLTNAYMKNEEAIAKLNAALIATGRYTPTVSKEMQKYAQEMQKLTKYSNDQTIAAQGVMATFTKISTKTFPEAIEAAMNMSAMFGQDLQQSVIQLGTALNDPIQGVGRLRRIGISFTEEQKKLIETLVKQNDLYGAQRVILDELGVEIGGVAKAVGETYAGKVKILENAFFDLKKEMGRLIADKISPMLPLITRMIENLSGWIQKKNELREAYEKLRKPMEDINDFTRIELLQAEQLVALDKIKSMEKSLALGQTNAMIAGINRETGVTREAVDAMRKEYRGRVQLIDNMTLAIKKRDEEAKKIKEGKDKKEEDKKAIDELIKSSDEWAKTIVWSGEALDLYLETLNSQRESQKWLKGAIDKTSDAIERMTDNYMYFGEVMSGQAQIFANTFNKSFTAPLERATDTTLYFGEAMSGQMQYFSQMASALNIVEEATEGLTEAQKEFRRTMYDVATVAASVTDTMSLAFSTMYRNKSIALDEWYNKEKAYLENTITDEEELAEEMEKLDEEMKEKTRQAKIEEAKASKAMAIFQTIIHTAQAVMSALAMFPPKPALAAFAATMGAAQLAIIMSQKIPKFQMGGIVPGGYGGGDRVPALLEPGEMVVRKEIVREQLHGGGGPIGGDVYFDGTKVGRWLSREIASKNIPIYSGAITNNR